MYKVSCFINGEYIEVLAMCLRTAELKRNHMVAYYIRQGLNFDIAPHIVKGNCYYA